MGAFGDVVVKAWSRVMLTFSHNWWLLLLSVAIATALRLYMNQAKVSAVLKRYEKAGIFVAVAVAVLTPFCSCGTMAVILGMMTSYISWGPVVAFMVASPLSSPQGLLYSASIFGWPFALTFFIASIVIGLAGGFVASAAERRGWLRNQSRLAPAGAAGTAAMETAAAAGGRTASACSCGSSAKPTPNVSSCCGSSPASSPVDYGAGCCGDSGAPTPVARACSCGSSAAPTPVGSTCSCGTASAPSTVNAVQTKPSPLDELSRFALEFGRQALRLGAYFFGFAFIGYLLNGLIPATLITTLFGSGRIYGIPLAATLGLPLYVNSEASLPLVRSFLELGMSPGSAMAFLITGAGTSFGAIAGMLTIAKRRVISIVVGTLWVGAILVGLLTNLLRIW